MDSRNPDEPVLVPSPVDVLRHPLALAIAAVFILAAAAPAAAFGGHRPGYCTQTAWLQSASCSRQVQEALLEAKAVCINLSDRDERMECFEEAWEERTDGNALCRAQLGARRNVCWLIGEDRFDPEWNPDDFDDDFGDLTMLNPYWPLVPGHHWEYEAPDETIVVDVRDATKLIEGVTCIVVQDVVSDEDGNRIEDTFDWYGAAKNGDVHYCGEIAQNFELFAGDDPAEAELVDVEGSWKHGRDGAKGGILIRKAPVVGETYRQEWFAGEAEDMATVLSNSYGYGNVPDLDQLVPQALAESLCNDDCVVTHEFSPVEPGVSERKYYAPGIGLFLEVNLEDGDIVELTGCNFDARCP